jgi:tetratricopeptide (TPR) repeat protein
VPLWKRKPRTRTELVAAADRARAKGRLAAAAAGYRRVLVEHDASDPHVHCKLAPVLTRLGDDAGALSSFRLAAEGHVRAGFVDRALAVYAQAREVFPLESDFHTEAARIHLARGRRADAAIALVRGGRALARARRADAIEMLRGAMSLQPGHVEATLALAPLLRREDRRGEALELLRAIEPGVRGAALRRVRWQILRASPGLRTAWRWIAAVAGRS